MIAAKDIWKDIENAGMAEYVSKYEIWMNSRELKDFMFFFVDGELNSSKNMKKEE